MEELVKALEKENGNVELYLKQINDLNDEEIITLFENTDINERVKDYILCYASERIKHLSTNSFIKVSIWANNVEEYKKNYFSKIEKMPFEEFVDLIYNGIYEPAILLELIKTDIYKRYLQQEKKEQKMFAMQCFDIQAKLDTFSNVEELDIIGKEVLNIINNATEITENIETMEYTYLQTLIGNIDFLELDSEAIKIGLELMKMQMKKCQLLTTTMVEFYLYYRVKELNLESVCKNIVVTLGKSNKFGHYSYNGDILKGGTLRIYYEYLINIYQRCNQTLKYKEINDVININFIEFLSHELNHALKMQYFENIYQKYDELQSYGIFLKNREANYSIRNSALLHKIGEDYHKYHDTFINEAQADLFSFFDSNKQMLTIFKDCYPKYIIENMVGLCAKRIVDFYTNDDGTMLSPMEKFDAFYLEHIGDEVQPIATDENPDIMNSLMMGDKIPLDVYAFLQKIANGEIKTIDLYQTLTTYLQNRNELSTNTLENELEEQTPTL